LRIGGVQEARAVQNGPIYLIQVHDRMAANPVWGRLIGASDEAVALARAEAMAAQATSVAVVRFELNNQDGRVITRRLIRRWGTLPPGALCEGLDGPVARAAPAADDEDVSDPLITQLLDELVGPVVRAA
jgi:hypothetical protein